MNLLVPGSGTTGIPAGSFNGLGCQRHGVRWDRPDVDRASVWVRDGFNFDGHAAAALSAVAGLWAGIDNGCLDMQETDSPKSERNLVVLALRSSSSGR